MAGQQSTVTGELADLSRSDINTTLTYVRSIMAGLDAAEAERRLAEVGPNLVTHETRPSVAAELWGRTRNPLNALLLTLAATSALLGDMRAASVIAIMVVLAVLTAFVQEHRSNDAAARLRAMVKTVGSVRRRGTGTGSDFTEVPIETLVPGDVVQVSAGDMIPGDMRVLEAKDLFVNQSTLTGESMPTEKFSAPETLTGQSTFDLRNLCFMGSNVVSGYGVGVLIYTGQHTCFGKLAQQIIGQREATAFDRGIDRFTWLMIRFIAVMAPCVFLINGLTKHNWLEALFFAVAVAVGLTPEMLPMIVTVNLAKGALAMSRVRVIVKRLQAIQNFGAMDMLCTDKTGTLTQDRIVLKRHLDIRGNESARVLQFAYLNSHFQSGLKNLLDVAVLEHVELHGQLGIDENYTKIDEIPFDFTRRRLSVVVAMPNGKHVLVCKGAVEEMFAVCSEYSVDDEHGPLDAGHFATARRETDALNADGFRVVAVAYKEMDVAQSVYSVADETGLTLLGYIAFLDPPKDTAAKAIAMLAAKGVCLKVLTGDNPIITRKVCHEVDLEPGTILLGTDIDAMENAELAEEVDRATVVAKLSPAQKERVIRVLQRKGHVVGFLGDGINDSPALKAADVGISVENAVDIAKESADIILLEKSLLVLLDGVVEGRKVFGNITKYIKMGASSNFGNMFSVLGASILLPFLPMAPLQVLTNNLLYDFSQTAIPTDRVDPEYLETPRRWDISNIFKFMVFIGPISSIFDYATYGMMWFVFDAGTNPALFQTGWFVESLLTQTLIIHIIRTPKLPFIESRASPALMTMSLLICAVGIALPYSWLAPALGFTTLPRLYWPFIVLMLICYAALTHAVKVWFVHRWGV